MGVILNKVEETDELTERIGADLRAKAEETAQINDDQKNPDFTEGSDYVRDLKKTGRFAWVWILLGIVAVGVLIVLGLTRNN